MVIKIFPTDTIETIDRKLSAFDSEEFVELAKEAFKSYILTHDCEITTDLTVTRQEYVKIRQYLPYSIAGVYSGYYFDWEEHEVDKDVTVSFSFNKEENCIDIRICD